MSDNFHDPRILKGMATQLDLRRQRLQAGDQPLGWKIGFGSPAAMQNLGTTAPLIGFLTGAARLQSGDTVSIVDWKKPALEPEVAIYINQDLDGDEGRQTVKQAVGALGPAIELVDVEFPPQDAETILANNIYNRHVILGDPDTARKGCNIDGLIGRVYQGQEQIAVVDDLQALTGDLIDLVEYVARLLKSVGEGLKAGEVIIAGSIIPPLWLDSAGPVKQVRFNLEPVDEITVGINS